MQTRKLFYEDSHLSSFTAKVLSCEQVKKGWEVTLDQTVFYPEGGGQACDLGTLGTAQVLDVQEKEEQIIHLCHKPLEVGSTVEGKIDWDRRFDLMQQHTGEHMVSGIINRLYGAHNVGFHMGWESITIDFDVEIPAEDLPRIEAMANEAVWRAQEVKCWYPSEEELPNVFYRTKKALPWPVRIVQVGNTDSCACCGVHVKNTGEIGLVKLFSCIKFRSGSRIEMLCGKRALDHLNAIYAQNAMVSHAFSAKATQTGAAAEKMNEVLAQYKYRLTGLENQVFDSIAKSHAGQENALIFQEGLDSTAVRRLADMTAQVVSGTAAVFSGDDRAGFAYARVTRQGDLKELCQKLNRDLSGRGGGRGGFCQGSVKATQAQIQDFFGEIVL